MATEVKFLKKKKFKSAVLFTGLPGIGLVGKICVDYLLRQIKTEKIAEISSNSFPPSVHTVGGLIELIKDEIYHYSFKGRDYLFLVGPIQPSLDIRAGSMQEHYEFAKAIVDSLKDKGLKEVYTLAGINVGEKRMTSEPRIVVAGTNKKFIEEWKKYGAVSDRSEGLISGAAGLIIGIAKEKGINGACLMGETNARLIYGDHSAAKKLLELLIKRYGFRIDMSKIEKESKDIERAFTQLSKQLEEQEEKPTPAGLSYVR